MDEIESYSSHSPRQKVVSGLVNERIHSVQNRTPQHSSLEKGSSSDRKKLRNDIIRSPPSKKKADKGTVHTTPEGDKRGGGTRSGSRGKDTSSTVVEPRLANKESSEN